MSSANATVLYKSWHRWWVSIILLLPISCIFLARLPRWYHPCNRRQFPSSLYFWSAAHFLHALPSLQQLTTNIYLAAIVSSANATVPYNCLHYRWVFIILRLLIRCEFLARLAEWPHPCNCCQLVSPWQWLPLQPTLPSLIIVGTTGGFSSFF